MDSRAEPVLNLCPERRFFKCGNRKKNHMVQDQGSRVKPGESLNGFPWRETLVPAWTCVLVLYQEEVKIPSTPENG